MLSDLLGLHSQLTPDAGPLFDWRSYNRRQFDSVRTSEHVHGLLWLFFSDVSLLRDGRTQGMRDQDEPSTCPSSALHNHLRSCLLLSGKSSFYSHCWSAWLLSSALPHPFPLPLPRSLKYCLACAWYRNGNLSCVFKMLECYTRIRPLHHNLLSRRSSYCAVRFLIP